MKNPLVVSIFRNIASILEIKGENVFRIRAYQRAADAIEGLSQDVEEYSDPAALTGIPGIGKDLASKIQEIVITNTCQAYEQLKKDVPEGVLELLKIPMVGPKTAMMLYEQLNIRNITGLEAAIRAGKLTGLKGIKEKTIENIEKGIALIKKGKERMPLALALQLADKFLAGLRKLTEVEKVSEAGSLRRRRETVRDIDILVVSKKPALVMGAFTRFPWVRDVLAKGETKSSVRSEEDIQVDCRVVKEDEFGAALVYFTGSKNFNIHLRTIGVKNGWKTSEYGVYDVSGKKEKLLAGRSEEDVFKLFGMDYIPPEMREDTGEIELALKHTLPSLVSLADIKGDLHCHSNWSDGVDTIEEMARVAKDLGYAYLAVTDHSQSLKIARGLDEARLRKKKKEIDIANRGLKGLRILFGTEVDIGPDGAIDYSDDILKQFDIVVAAVHTAFRQDRTKMTARMVSACRNKYVHIIAHPTGRLWGERDAYEIDMEEVLKAAADTNTAMEINSFPQRLDLNDQYARMAKERGVRIAINTDSHAIGHLGNMKLGLSVARRGWLEPQDVLNTYPLEKLLRTIRK
jgi:DNA polymerase (family 10)